MVEEELESEVFSPTQDVDLLGFGDRSLDRVSSVFRDLCALAVEADGWVFDPATVEGEDIRTVDEYGGVRIHLTGALGGAKIRVQVDIGFGDAVTPPASVASYPSLLGFPAPQLRVYPRETVVAEKFEAIVKLGLLNSRYKDYFDLRHLARHFEFDGELLRSAMAATFSRRGTPLPTGAPAGLSAAFGDDPAKQTQWTAFTRRLTAETTSALSEVVREVAAFVVPPRAAAARSEAFRKRWTPSAQWHETL